MMTTPLDLEIRARLMRLLNGETTLREFARWFLPATWNVEATGNDEAVRQLE